MKKPFNYSKEKLLGEASLKKRSFTLLDYNIGLRLF